VSEPLDLTVNQPKPYRDDLTQAEVRAARLISPELWSQRYVPRGGPMHFATGPGWPRLLREKAKHWRKLADAAEVCAAAIDRTNVP
jgi:hypothetical protein